VSFWHWPIIRTFAEGFPWVCVFFTLSGFVNSLKPVKLMRNDNQSAALTVLATSAFRRSLRLMLPCTLVTTITWIGAQAGAFEIGKANSNGWLSRTSPGASEHWYRAIPDLVWSVWTTWTDGSNYYDQNQWSMVSFLMGSLALYVILLATSKCSTIGRMVIVFLMFCIGLKRQDCKSSSPSLRQPVPNSRAR
jgi:hypothetical protein